MRVPGLDPGIDPRIRQLEKNLRRRWIAGSSPAMTELESRAAHFSDAFTSARRVRIATAIRSSATKQDQKRNA
jgi:hypothetical protein